MPRRKLEGADTRLLAAGLHLFARHGCEAVNSNRIARRAGLGIGTFYSHFTDKYALLREIQLRTLAGLQSARTKAVADAGPDPREQVRRAIAAAVRFAQLHPAAYRVTFGRERLAAKPRGPVVSESSRPTAVTLRALQQAGRLPAELDVDLAARAYLAMEVGTLLWWLEDPRRANADGLVDTLGRMHPVEMSR
jgi:AcrR family transcriptional regulator